jgi:hypothetical protein
MNSSKLILITTIIILTPLFLSNAGPSEKTHGIGLQLGMWNQVTGTRTEVGIGSTTTSVEASGFLGGLFYENRFQDNLAWNISIGGMLANVEVNTNITGTSTEAAFVVPILFGIKYYFAHSTFNTSVRPYAKAAVGPFIGQQEKSEENITGVVIETRSETAFGGQLGGGVDFLMGRYFMTGFSLGYNLISDFDQPIGGSRNYSGPVFNFGLSVLF